MKKTTLFFGFILSILSCRSKEEDNALYDFTFRNNTDYNVTVMPFENLITTEPYFTFPVASKETKTFNNGYLYGAFKIKSNETMNLFNYKISGDERVIYSFKHLVEYKVSGTAKNADITYSTSSGGTNQQTITMPYNITFNEFKDGFKYISAQNNNQSGTVKVEIYYEDKLVSSDVCSSSYCIASASYSK